RTSRIDRMAKAVACRRRERRRFRRTFSATAARKADPAGESSTTDPFEDPGTPDWVAATDEPASADRGASGVPQAAGVADAAPAGGPGESSAEEAPPGTTPWAGASVPRAA